MVRGFSLQYPTAAGYTILSASPLHYAASFGQLPMVRFLVTHGADISLTDNSGLTPYQFATMFPSKSAATLKELGH
jgi:ankyrin repeat protein